MVRSPALTRDSFIPKGSVKVADRKSDAVAYLFTTPRGAAGYVVFVGKSVKPMARACAAREDYRARHIAEHFRARQLTLEGRAKLAAQQAAEAAQIAVGDVLRSSWGYDQTNVNFYQVVDRKGSTVTLRPIASEQVDNSHTGPGGVATPSLSGYVAPLVDSFIGEAFKKRITSARVKISSYSTASRLGFETMAGVRVYARSYVSSYA